MAKKRKFKLTARTADRYVLYTDAVQTVQAEVTFFKRLYETHNGCPPVLLREDFCGTAALCCQWAHIAPDNRAIGVDLDPEPLSWSRGHYLALLPADARKRIRLRRADVLEVKTPRPDVICALNFSFCVFKRREVMLRYLRKSCRDLAPGGIMVMDIYGGPEGQKVMTESTPFKGYTYIWDQACYNPVTHEALNHIHFHFRDGTKMRKAFTYDWRLWTLAELTDLLAEAGFRESRVYWEDTGPDGEGNGVYRHRRRADAEEGWVAYVIGLK